MNMGGLAGDAILHHTVIPMTFPARDIRGEAPNFCTWTGDCDGVVSLPGARAHKIPVG
jgi:hypothetical protein